MRRIAVVDAPSNLGLRPPTATSVPGCAKAPGALRDHNLLARLGARDAGCVTPPRYDPAGWQPGDGVAQAAEIAVYVRRLADRVGTVLATGDFPLVLGGDCSILLGAGLAMRRYQNELGGRIGLIYVDGHSDFRHEGNASYVGAAAGEALALATGRGQANLASIEQRRPYFRDVDVVLLGIRTHDEYRLDLQAAGIVARAVPELRSDGAARSAQWARDQLRDCAGFWVHVDVDVLDPAVMPAVDAPDVGGIAYRELEILLSGLVSDPRCLGAQVTVFDPDYDPDGQYAAEVVDVLVAGLEPLVTSAALATAPDPVISAPPFAAPVSAPPISAPPISAPSISAPPVSTARPSSPVPAPPVSTVRSSSPTPAAPVSAARPSWPVPAAPVSAIGPSSPASASPTSASPVSAAGSWSLAPSPHAVASSDISEMSDEAEPSTTRGEAAETVATHSGEERAEEAPEGGSSAAPSYAETVATHSGEERAEEAPEGGSPAAAPYGGSAPRAPYPSLDATAADGAGVDLVAVDGAGLGMMGLDVDGAAVGEVGMGEAEVDELGAGDLEANGAGAVGDLRPRADRVATLSLDSLPRDAMGPGGLRPHGLGGGGPFVPAQAVRRGEGDSPESPLTDVVPAARTPVDEEEPAG